MPDIILRPAKPSDVNFLTSSWLKSYRNAPTVKGVPNSVYYYYHHKLLEELLTRCEVLIACYEDRQDQILGYICAETFDTALLVHYVYVKKTFRRLGIGKRLASAVTEAEGAPAVLYTHKTRDMFILESRLRDDGWIFHPYMLWVSLPEKWED